MNILTKSGQNLMSEFHIMVRTWLMTVSYMGSFLFLDRIQLVWLYACLEKSHSRKILQPLGLQSQENRIYYSSHMFGKEYLLQDQEHVKTIELTTSLKVYRKDQN